MVAAGRTAARALREFPCVRPGVTFSHSTTPTQSSWASLIRVFEVISQQTTPLISVLIMGHNLSDQNSSCQSRLTKPLNSFTFMQRLGPPQFAYLRAVAEGVPRADAARRYLAIHHGALLERRCAAL